MTTATATKIADWIENLGTVVNATSDTFRIALSNTAPASETNNPTATGNGVLANVTQVSYTNYSDNLTVDRQLQSVTFAEAAGTTKFDAADFIITASGGTLATFRYIYVYDDTPTSPADPLVQVWDYGSGISLADTQTATITFHANGMFTIA
ncbi:MAG: hypothetical protein RL268_485 [Pseudomonadota bacterium]|jgi:hypothetical protein